MINTIIWAIICVVLLVVEFITIGDFITIWFSLGAFLSCILSMFWDNLTAQITLFVVVSFAALIAFRPLCLKAIRTSEGNTNLDIIKKSKVVIIDPITSNNNGTAKLEGVIWNCVSNDNSEIATGTLCDVIEVKGNKLIVTPSK